MSSKTQAKITSAPDGPFLVDQVSQITNQKGAIESKEKMALCRCGASKNKPFCDGAHKAIFFSSAKIDGRLSDVRESYVGERVTVHDNRSLCAHAGACTEGLPTVFRYKQEPWIDANAAEHDQIVKAVAGCPSGALSYSIEDVERTESLGDARIFVAPNGPYVVSGRFDLADTNQAVGAAKGQVTLCRCGASKNKPFCDGSHWAIEFKDEDN